MIANNSLSQYFHNHFRVVVADTEVLREEVYKIRKAEFRKRLQDTPEENTALSIELEFRLISTQSHRLDHAGHLSAQAFAIVYIQSQSV